MPVITVPKILRDELGEEASDSLIELINEATESIGENTILIVEEKFERRLTEEVSKLREEMSRLRNDLDKRITEEIAKVRVDMASLKTELKGDIATLRTEMVSFKADIIKWMFLFWIGQLVVIAGLIKFIR